MNSNDFINLILWLAKVGSVVSIIVCAVGIVKLIQSKKNGEGGFRYIKIIVESAIVAFVCIVGLKGINKEMEITGSYIEQNHPASIANITYGQAIRNVCDNIEWTRITSEASSDGHAFVQMDADCNYEGRDWKLVIQFDYGIEDFALVDEDTPFEISFVGFDDAQNTNVSEMQDIMYSMFEFYADENGIRLDESMKEGILYTNGASAALALLDDAVDSETSYNDDASYDTDALSDAGQTYQESAPESEYTDYLSWCGVFSMEGLGLDSARMVFMLYPDGTRNDECGFVAINYVEDKWVGQLYYLGGNEFRWENALGRAGQKDATAYISLEAGEDLAVHDSDGRLYMFGTMITPTEPLNNTGDWSPYDYLFMERSGSYIMEDGNGNYSGNCELLLHAARKDGKIGTIDVQCDALATFTGTVYESGNPNEYMIDTGMKYWYLVFSGDESFILRTEPPKAAIDAGWMTWGPFSMVAHYQPY